MIKHRYWVSHQEERPAVYVHRTQRTQPGSATIDVTELVSVTGGVRTVESGEVGDDPEWAGFGFTRQLTARQYHRKRWKVLQKQKGKK